MKINKTIQTIENKVIDMETEIGKEEQKQWRLIASLNEVYNSKFEQQNDLDELSALLLVIAKMKAEYQVVRSLYHDMMRGNN